MIKAGLKSLVFMKASAIARAMDVSSVNSLWKRYAHHQSCNGEHSFLVRAMVGIRLALLWHRLSPCQTSCPAVFVRKIASCNTSLKLNLIGYRQANFIGDLPYSLSSKNKAAQAENKAGIHYPTYRLWDGQDGSKKRSGKRPVTLVTDAYETASSYSAMTRSISCSPSLSNWICEPRQVVDRQTNALHYTRRVGDDAICWIHIEHS